MKLRSPRLIKAAALAAAQLGRLWMGTLRFRYRALGPDVRPQRARPGDRYIYAFWHEDCLVPPFGFASARVHVVVSRHADGEMIGEVCRHLRVPVVRGSTTRGGVEAVRRILHNRRLVHLALTPDGPRGPRRVLQAGVIYLAARTGIPIVPCGVGYGRAWRLGTWDRMAVPRPWSLVTCVSGSPIAVPADAGRRELETHRRLVQRAMEAVSAAAGRWAQTGRGLAAPLGGLGECRPAG
jgi:lysophospholipid acyltransferase (LPLAT)-like uncharacterized protein